MILNRIPSGHFALARRPGCFRNGFVPRHVVRVVGQSRRPSSPEHTETLDEQDFKAVDGLVATLALFLVPQDDGTGCIWPLPVPPEPTPHLRW